MKRNPTRKAAIPPLLIAALALGALAGCSGSDPALAPAPGAQDAGILSAPYANAGTLRLTLLDGPVAFDDFILVLKGISAHRASGDSLDGWYRLDFEPAEYHLLDLTNGVSALLTDAELPAGPYDQIRLLLDEGNRVVVDGVEHDLIIPSGLQSGIKIHHEFEIVAGEDYAATLDFDAARSVRLDGRGRYRLQPVIRVQETASAGSITGMVMPAEAATMVWTVAGPDTVTAFADTEMGVFTLAALPAGLYDLNFTPTAEGPWLGTSLPDVAVAAGQATDVGTVNLIMPE